MNSVWDKDISVGAKLLSCQTDPLTDGRAELMNSAGNLDNWSDLSHVFDFDGGCEYANGLLAEDDKVVCADFPALADWLEQWTIARGSTKAQQEGLMMYVACQKATALLAGFATLLSVASLV